MRKHGWLGVALGGFVTCLATVIGLPVVLLAGGGGSGSSELTGCGPGAPAVPGDGSPGILGPATLTRTELTSWWDTTGRAQPPALAAPVDEVVALYMTEGDAEGVRGDVAFAQAVLETGHFTSTDTGRNNFAGIGHPDGAAAGRSFPSAPVGVRAHVQLLKKYAAGNDADLVHPDVAPDAGAHARTWGELAGTWASSPDYSTSISAIYDSMLTHAGRDLAEPPANCTSRAPVADGTGTLVDVRGIVVHTSIAANLDALLAAATTDGLTLTGSGYRSHARQIELRRAHCGPSDYAVYDMPAGDCSPPTARPGTSNHEQGLAIDFNNCSTRSTRCYQWLAANASQFGFRNLPSEPWHWSVDGR